MPVKVAVCRWKLSTADLAPPVLQFTQKKADGEIRWAILTVVTLLRRHRRSHKQLAKAMAAGKSVSECLAIIESNFPREDTRDPLVA